MNYTYNTADELTAAGTTTYTYDHNGNETAAGATAYGYDLANRLGSTTSGGTTTNYSYDGDGNRLQASTGSQASQKTNYLWDTNGDLAQMALERDGNNALLRRYIYGVRRISMTAGSSPFYYAYDGLGSVANVTSSTGATEWTYAYEPFGTSRSETQNDPAAPTNLMKFTGEYSDPTGLYYLRARQYDSANGRFLQVDPIAKASSQVSTYAYVDDHATVTVDPSGQMGVPATAGTCVASFVTALTISEDTHPTSSAGCPDVPGTPWIIPFSYDHYYPYDRKLVVGRIDAGVDSKFSHKGPIFAIAASRVINIDPVGTHPWVGLGALRFKLDQAITVNGRSYGKWYTAESGYLMPSLIVGSPVAAGQRVAFTSSGWQETGFWANQDKDSQVPTQEGRDFFTFIMRMRKLGHYAPGA
jgi:RHS repeat-associated protein